MKKTIILILFLTSGELGFAQWNVLVDTLFVSSIQFIQPNNGWAFGRKFYHYNGTTWTSFIYDTWFADNTSFFTSGNNGWVFSSSQDSAYRYNGSIWTKQYTGFTGDYCHFSDSSFGWVVNINSTHKYDNGIWTSYPLSNTYPVSVSSCGHNTGWLISWPSSGSIKSEINKFVSNQWVVDTLFYNTTLTSIFFTDSTHGWASGYDSILGGVIYKYNGSGWNLDFATHNMTIFTIIYFYNINAGWFSDSRLVYNYNGSNWTLSDTLPCLTQFSFVDPIHGWALSILKRCINDVLQDIIYNTNTGGLGLEEIKVMNLFNVTISPNPASTSITLTSPTNQNISLSIYNIVGELMLQRTLTKSTSKIDIASLAKGVYIINVSGKDWTAQRKLVKE